MPPQAPPKTIPSPLKDDGSFDFKNEEVCPDGGPIKWHSILLEYPSGQGKLFHHQLTPRHMAQAFFGGRKFSGDPNKALRRPYKERKDDGLSSSGSNPKSRKVKATKENIFDTACDLAMPELEGRFGWHLGYCKTNDKPFPGMKRAGNSSTVPFICLRCAARNIFTVCAVCHVHCIDDDSKKAAVAGLVNMGDGSTVDSASIPSVSSDGTEKVGWLEVVLLFPHDSNCTANSAHNQQNYMMSPIKTYNSQDVVCVSSNPEYVFEDTFKHQVSLIDGYFGQHPDQMPNVAGLQRINLGNAHHSDDDRSYCLLPVEPPAGGEPMVLPSENPLEMFSNLTPQFMAPFFARLDFHLMCQLGLEKEMCPYLIDWDPEANLPTAVAQLGKNKGGRPTKQLQHLRMIKWKQNPSCHLFVSETSHVLGGADSGSLGGDQLASGSGDHITEDVTHQGGHRDHANLREYLADPEQTPPWPRFLG